MNDTTPQASAPVRRSRLANLILSTSRPYRLVRTGALGLALGAALLTLRDAVISLQGDNPLHKDFIQEYVLARATASGDDPYVGIRTLAERYIGTVPVVVFEHPTPHPPTVGVLLLPLAAFDYPTAAAIWLGVELVCLVLSSFLVLRLAGRWPTVRDVAVVSVVMLAWSPIYAELISGQLMLMILTLLAGSLLAERTGRPGLAGLLSGLAILFKPVPWPIVVLYAVRQQWRALGVSLTTIAAGVTVAGLTIGWRSLIVYATQVTPEVGLLYRNYAENQSFWTIGWRLFEGTDWPRLGQTVMIGVIAPPLLKSLPLARIVSIALPALLIAWAAYVGRKMDRAIGFGLIVCVSILVSPITWFHYLVLAALPIAGIIGSLAAQRFPAAASWVAVACVTLLTITPLAWTDLALIVSGEPVPPSLTGVALPPASLTVPFLAGLVTLVPTAATVGLVFLVRSSMPSTRD